MKTLPNPAGAVDAPIAFLFLVDYPWRRATDQHPQASAAMNASEPYAKEKIGSHLSYPLKFGEVVSLLSPAVEQLNIQVWFRAWDAPRQNEQLDRYEILEAGYWERFPDAQSQTVLLGT